MPGRCPKLGSNVSTSLPARCSGKLLNGGARGSHAELAPPWLSLSTPRVPATLLRGLLLQSGRPSLLTPHSPSRMPSPSFALLSWAPWSWPPLTPSEAHAATAALGVAPSPPPLLCLGTARMRRHNPCHAGPLVSAAPSPPRRCSSAWAAVGSRWPDRPFLGRPWVSPLPCQPRPRLRHHACSRRRSTTAPELADRSVLCDVRRRRKKKGLFVNRNFLTCSLCKIARHKKLHLRAWLI